MSFDVVTSLSAARYMSSMGQVTSAMMLRVIDQDLDDEFNAHELCEALRRRYPHEYSEEILQKASSADPEKTAGASVAARLNFAPFDATVRNIGFEWTHSPRGNRSRVALWRKK